MTEPEIADAYPLQPHTCHNDTGGTRCDVCFGPLDGSVPVTAAVTVVPALTITPDMLVKIAREVAMDIQEMPQILAQFSLTPEQYRTHVEPNAFFQRALEAYRIEWNSALSTKDRIRVQAATALEHSLPHFATRLTKNDESLDAQVKAAALFAKLADIGESKGEEGSSEKFSIVINLGADTKLKYEKNITPRKEASVAEELRALTEGGGNEIAVRPVGKEN